MNEELLLLNQCPNCNQFKSPKDFINSKSIIPHERCSECRDKNKITLEEELKNKENGVKKCNDCFLVKPLSDFEYRNDLGHYRGQCIKCYKKKRAKWEKTNRKLLLQRKKDYYSKNREYMNEANKKIKK